MKPTYGLVVSQEAHVLVALWVGAVRLENKGESVAWRQQGLRARMIPVGRILIPTKLSQNLTIEENLQEHVRNITPRGKVVSSTCNDKECDCTDLVKTQSCIVSC